MDALKQKRFNKLVKDSIKKDRGSYMIMQTLDTYYKDLYEEFEDESDVSYAIWIYIDSQQDIHAGREPGKPEQYLKSLKLLKSKGFTVSE